MSASVRAIRGAMTVTEAKRVLREWRAERRRRRGLPPRKPRLVRTYATASRRGFRAASWLHFWETSGCPRWRACAWGLAPNETI
jgi:hypothetical protein